ncbi:MAG: alkyl hydroperoxide reductase [Acidobacteria bacterium OLB17]|nr:MAG: alkyl hydroperoxide reductase [Acidobacteria bacterium OLB17]
MNGIMFMKSFLPKIVLFSCLALLFSSLSGCGSAESAANGSQQEKPVGNNYPVLKDDIVDVDIELVKGGTMRIKDRRGKVVLLNLWATWCGPCREEMPHLIELQKKYGDKGFEVVGLNVGFQDTDEPEPIEDIEAFAKKMRLNYELARVQPDVSKKLQKISQVSAVPESFLVDREGKLRGVFVGGGPKVISQLKTSVDNLMAE